MYILFILLSYYGFKYKLPTENSDVCTYLESKKVILETLPFWPRESLFYQQGKNLQSPKYFYHIFCMPSFTIPLTSTLFVIRFFLTENWIHLTWKIKYNWPKKYGVFLIDSYSSHIITYWVLYVKLLNAILLFFFRFNMSSIRQVINDAVERGKSEFKVFYLHVQLFTSSSINQFLSCWKKNLYIKLIKSLIPIARKGKKKKKKKSYKFIIILLISGWIFTTFIYYIII